MLAASTLLAAVALAAAAVRPGDDRVARGYPVPVALLTAAAASAITVYDADWRLAAPSADHPPLALTLVAVPFALAVSAGLRIVRSPDGPRRAGAVALLCGLGWLAVWALPRLPSWGPVLIAVPLGALVAGAVHAGIRRPGPAA